MNKPQRPRQVWPATAAILVAITIVWLFQVWLYRYHPDSTFDDYFALSLEGLKHGYIWQLLTYQFMHAAPFTYVYGHLVPEPWHLLLNAWAIFIFGRAVEITVGKWQMLRLYFLSGIIGGLVQMLAMAALPALFGTGGAVGASASAFGLMAAFAVLYPREQLYVLLFFVVPLRLKSTTFLLVLLALTVFGMLEPLFAHLLPASLTDSIFLSNVAHAAHLGGMAAGFLLALQYVRRAARFRGPPPVIEVEAKTSLNITPAQD